jgi:2-keto-4-pentenoate hydratase/2-oxohepta-3-ene-1,7-dioic acid hydratase in catechol pathway
MKLVTYQDGTNVRVGVVQQDFIIELTRQAPDMLSLIEKQRGVLACTREIISNFNNNTPMSTAVVPTKSVKLLAPIPRPRKNMVCLGKNYAAHAVETARARGRPEVVPDQPVFFTKAVTAINHPDALIPYDATISTELDWEVELAIVIGEQGKNIPREEAMDYVFGYTIMNDISARDLQSRHRQFYKGKSLDGSAPLGPWIVTVDEIADPHNLPIRLRVNDEIMQDANTRDMVHTIPDIIAVLSQGMTLEPGDIIATGTPSGVGMAMEPPRFLQPGDVIEAEIEGIGVLRNTIAS